MSTKLTYDSVKTFILLTSVLKKETSCEADAMSVSKISKRIENLLDSEFFCDDHVFADEQMKSSDAVQKNVRRQLETIANASGSGVYANILRQEFGGEIKRVSSGARGKKYFFLRNNIKASVSTAS